MSMTAQRRAARDKYVKRAKKLYPDCKCPQKFADTRTPCSRFDCGCGNPRRGMKGDARFTMRELRHGMSIPLIIALFCSAAVLGGCSVANFPTCRNVGKHDDAPWMGMEIEPANGPSKATPAGAVYGPSVLVGTTDVRAAP